MRGKMRNRSFCFKVLGTYVEDFDKNKVSIGMWSGTAELKDVTNATHLAYNKSIIMATYMLCGFANFGSIGIQIGGIAVLAPNQRSNLATLALRAMIGGMVACLMTACVAGLFLR